MSDPTQPSPSPWLIPQTPAQVDAQKTDAAQPAPINPWMGPQQAMEQYANTREGPVQNQAATAQAATAQGEFVPDDEVDYSKVVPAKSSGPSDSAEFVPDDEVDYSKVVKSSDSGFVDDSEVDWNAYKPRKSFKDEAVHMGQAEMAQAGAEARKSGDTERYDEIKAAYIAKRAIDVADKRQPFKDIASGGGKSLAALMKLNFLPLTLLVKTGMAIPGAVSEVYGQAKEAGKETADLFSGDEQTQRNAAATLEAATKVAGLSPKSLGRKIGRLWNEVLLGHEEYANDFEQDVTQAIDYEEAATLTSKESLLAREKNAGLLARFAGPGVTAGVPNKKGAEAIGALIDPVNVGFMLAGTPAANLVKAGAGAVGRRVFGMAAKEAAIGAGEVVAKGVLESSAEAAAKDAALKTVSTDVVGSVLKAAGNVTKKVAAADLDKLLPNAGTAAILGGIGGGGVAGGIGGIAARASAKAVGRGLQKAMSPVGEWLAKTGERVAAGEGVGAMGANAVGGVAKAGMHGLAFGAPFALLEDTTEDASRVLATGFAFGAAAGGATQALGAANAAARGRMSVPRRDSSIVRQPMPEYGTEFDAGSQKNLGELSNAGMARFDVFRKIAEVTSKTAVETYYLGKEEMAKLAKSLGMDESAGATAGFVKAVTDAEGNVVKKVIAISADQRGIAAGHEPGHIIWSEGLTDAQRAEFIDHALSTVGIKGLEEYKRQYNEMMNEGKEGPDHLVPGPGESWLHKIAEEYFAEQFSHHVNSLAIDLSGGLKKPSLRRELLSKAGKVVEEKTNITPEAGYVDDRTALGWRPTLGARAIIDSFINENLSNISKPAPASTAKPAAAKAPAADGSIPAVSEVVVKPTPEGIPKGTPIETFEKPDGAQKVIKGKVVKEVGRGEIRPNENGENTFYPNEDGEKHYLVEHGKKVWDKDRGMYVQKGEVVPESWLQSKTDVGAVNPDAQVFHKRVTPSTPPGAALTLKDIKPGDAHLFVDEKGRPITEAQVERARNPTPAAPAAEKGEPLPAAESANPNLRATPERQKGFEKKGTPEEQSHNDKVFTENSADRSKAVPFEINHSGAVSGETAPNQVLRERQRLASEAEGTGALKRVWQKIFVPFKMNTTKKGIRTVFGLSMDKVIQNVDILAGWQKNNGGIDPWLQSEQAVTDIQIYLKNQSNGFGGDGRRLKLPLDTKEGSVTPENPSYTPVPLDKLTAQKINALMGYPPSPGDYYQRFAELNQEKVGRLANGRAEVNPYRDGLRKAGFDLDLLNQAVEQIRIADIVGEAKPRPDLNFGAGDTGITRAGFMPVVKKRAQGNQATRDVAEQYAKDAGILFRPHGGNALVDEPRAKRIADAYGAAADEPNNPAVQKAYRTLIDETKAQYDTMVASGVKIEPYEGKGEPYPSSKAMMEDVRDNNHLYFLKTENAYGQEGQKVVSPMLEPSGVKINGKELLNNDLFRAVHDYFGHTAEGYEFGPRGEFNAYLAHSRMFSPEAVPALAAETLAQNSWVNYGEHLRRPDGSIPKPGDADFKPLAERPFAEQKTTVVPQELIDEVNAATQPDDSRFMPDASKRTIKLKDTAPDREYVADKLFEFADKNGLTHVGAGMFLGGEAQLEMKPGAGREWRLSFIGTKGENRAQGAASRLLSKITNAADEAGIRITLNADPQGGGLSKDQLVSWYERNGFERQPYLMEPGVMSDAMVREPSNPDARYMPAPPKDSPEFKAWFRRSAVHDENGTPTVVYHGTPTAFGLGDFTVFDAQAARRKFNRPPSMDQVGSWFSSKPGQDGAGMYAGGENAFDPSEIRPVIYPVFLSIQRPFLMSSPEFIELGQKVGGWKKGNPIGGFDGVKVREYLQQRGYDGILFEETNIDGGNHDVWVAFEPNQIKSATGNRGTYDPANPDIRYMPVGKTVKSDLSKLTVSEKKELLAGAKWYVENKDNDPKLAKSLKTAKDLGRLSDEQVTESAKYIGLELASEGAARDAFVAPKEYRRDFKPAADEDVQLAPNKGERPLPNTVPEDVLDGVHFTNRSDLTTIDPTMSKARMGPAAIMSKGEPKSFFFVRGSKPLPGENINAASHRVQYPVKLSGDTLYDMDADPLNLWASSKDSPSRGNWAKMDASLREAGYSGYVATTADGRHFAATYYPVKVAPKNSGADFMPAVKEPFYSQAERTLEAIPEKATRDQIAAAIRDGVKHQGKLIQRPIKAEELRDIKDPTGQTLEQYMQDNPDASRRDLLDFAQQNKVQVSQSMRGGEKTAEKRAELEDIKDDAAEQVRRANIEEESMRLEIEDKALQDKEFAPNGREDRGASNDLRDFFADPQVGYLPYSVKPLGGEYISLISRLEDLRQDAQDAAQILYDFNNKARSTYTKFEDQNLKGGVMDNYREEVFTVPEGTAGSDYQSGHFSDKGYIAHTRYNEREMEPSGEKVLHVEEIQSDLHQKGRKEGYQSDITPGRRQELVKQIAAARLESERLHEDYAERIRMKETVEEYAARSMRKLLAEKGLDGGESVSDYTLIWAIEGAVDAADPAVTELKKLVGDANRAVDDAYGARRAAVAHESQLMESLDQSGKTPDAPFKKSWPELVFKHLLRRAAEMGVDRMTWTTGEQQNARYQLSKHLDRVELRKGTDGKTDHLTAYDLNGRRIVDEMVTPEQLALNVGEELADKLTQMEWADGPKKPLDGLLGQNLNRQNYKVLSGVGLEVGGAGMKGFYDKMIPSFADKIGKKWGVKTEDVTLSGDHTVHSLPLTEAMRKDILDNGQALYMPSPVAQKHLEQFNGDTVKQAMKKPGWAILTATQEAVDNGNPFSPANVAANDALAAELRKRGLPFKEVSGSYAGNDQGRSFLVTGISEKDAMGLGKEFKQDSILNNRGFVYSEDGSVSPINHEGTTVGEEALKQEGHTVLPDGTPFSVSVGEKMPPAPKTTAPKNGVVNLEDIADLEYTVKGKEGESQQIRMGDRYEDQMKYEEALPLQFQMEKGKVVVDKKGPKILTRDYDFFDSPVVAELNLDPEVLKSLKTKLNNTTLSQMKAGYVESLPAPEKAALKSMVDAYATKAVTDMGRYIKDPAIKAAAGWYSEISTFFKKLIPDVGDRTKFLEFLGGTSPNTSVEQNFLYALDLFNRWKKGGLKAVHDSYQNVKTNFDSLASAYAEKTPVLSPTGAQKTQLGKTVYEWLLPPGAEGKFKEAYTKALVEDGWTPKEAKAEVNKGFDEDSLRALVNLQNGVKLERGGEGGGKYGVHTDRILQILDGVWREETNAPKAPNFTENLAGLSNRATIDVWAARWLRRLGWDGMAEKWRILPMAESGVANFDFFLGQEIFAEATKRVNEKFSQDLGRTIGPDDLQALMWFAEKREWKNRGWSKSEDLGDFRQYAYKLKPQADGTFSLAGATLNSTSLDFLKTLSGVQVENTTLSASQRGATKRLSEAVASMVQQAKSGKLSPGLMAKAEQKFLAAKAERTQKINTDDYRK